MRYFGEEYMKVVVGGQKRRGLGNPGGLFCCFQNWEKCGQFTGRYEP